jgi:hypothetical protein|tara:strand:- start:137 stop:295 length:159 start_codon:yes stop_codon:yes gene_type:complete
MKNDIANVMDVVIFNINIKRTSLDRGLYSKNYSENKWIKPEVQEDESIGENE